jgi:hypothetical protein
VNAATVARFEESFNRIASECGIRPPDGAKSDTAVLLKNWLEVRHVGSWLMVIDNVDNGDAFFRGLMSIGKSPSECIPRCPNGSLLFTTRSRDVAFDAANPEMPIMIHGLGKEEGLSLVRKRLRQNCSEELIIELLQELEYIPLAITQAIAFMIKRQNTIEQYLRQYRKSDATKTKFLSYEFSEHARPENTLESVTKTWRLSFESIRDSNRRAADLLCLINFFQHHGIPAILLQDKEAEDDFDFQEAAALLKAFSFLSEHDSLFSTHRLVQLATRWWLEAQFPEDLDRWAFAALKSIASHFPRPSNQPGPEYFKLAEILFPHAELILQHQFKETTEDSELARAKLLMSSGRYIFWAGNYHEALRRFEQSMIINCSYLGEKHVETMESMGLFGWATGVLDQDQTALPILEHVVSNKRDILGEDDPSTIISVMDLAAVIALTEDYATSEAMLREALTRSERVNGRKHNTTLNCMAYLADVLRYQHKTEEAVKLRQDTYDAKMELLGNRHPDTLIHQGILALLLSESDETSEEAISLWRLNLRDLTEVRGPNHRETLITAYNFIRELVLQQRNAEAQELCAQCLAKADDDLYKDNLDSQRLLKSINPIWQRLKETNTAEEIMKAR